MIKNFIRLCSFIFLVTSMNARASFIYWNFGNDVGSEQFWKYGTKEGSAYFWKHGTTEGSQYFWKYGTSAGSNYFWKNGRTSGSKYFWDHGKEPGSRYYWKNGKGPGSRYFWENGETASFGPIFTSLCKSGSIEIAPCKLMIDNPIDFIHPPSEMLNDLITPDRCVGPNSEQQSQ